MRSWDKGERDSEGSEKSLLEAEISSESDAISEAGLGEAGIKLETRVI